MTMSPQLQQALDLVQRHPLPKDIQAQLERLAQAAPAEESEMFGDLMAAATLEQGPTKSR